MSQVLSCPGPVLGSFLRADAAGGLKRSLAAKAALPSPAFSAIGTVKHPCDSSSKAVSELPPCHNVKELLCVGLHWHVPFIEVLLETVQVVW